jgi:hypothetical protein
VKGLNLTLQSTVVFVKDHVSTDLGSESVILNVNSGVYYGLDEVGNRVWQLLQEPRTVLEIRDALLNEYEVEAGECGRDLLELLHLMQNEGLISVDPTTNEKSDTTAVNG